MTDLGHLVWLVAMAVMTVTVLTVGTLASAGLLTRRERAPLPGARTDREPETLDHPPPRQHAA